MDATGISRKTWLVTTGVFLFAAIILINWQNILSATAMSAAEQRPELLNDATWNNPMSARKFRSAFGPGSSEAALLSWLRSNGFAIERADGHASRKIRGFPCAEELTIDWIKGTGGKIDGATMNVSEAGCL